MAKSKRKTKSKKASTKIDTFPNAAFVQLPINRDVLIRFGKTCTQIRQSLEAESNHKILQAQFARQSNQHPESQHDLQATIVRNEDFDEDMKTRDAWKTNLANPNRVHDSPTSDHNVSQSPASQVSATYNPSSLSAPKSRSILKPKSVLKSQISAARSREISTTGSTKKKVTVNPYPDILYGSSDSSNDSEGSTLSNDAAEPPKMSQKPTLKLKLSQANIQRPEVVQSPNPQSGQRTPSLKLNLGGKPSVKTVKVKKEDTNGDANGSASKKRKRELSGKANGNDVSAARPQAIRKLTLKTNKAAQTPITPVIKLKSKGKVPKRPLGVGYDSELDDREIDPVIIEGFILRMLPGPDCDYVQTAITNGTVGVSRVQGGADIRMRVLDTHGRRGILIVKGTQYATTLVDLPCVVEGMKSWDKKGFIKSIDVSQMMLVLGPCKSDDESRNYPLPEDVDPKTYQYAHGLTPPMKWVRKRRFARTKRARVDDIEAVERRVNALLEADRNARSSRYQLLDRDPRLEVPQYTSDFNEDEDEDAEGEEDDLGDDYFAATNGQNGTSVGTPMYADTPAEEIEQEDVDEVTRMLEEDDFDEAPTTAATPTVNAAHPNALDLPEGANSSFAVTSTSASPSATAGQTPGSASANGPVDQSSDEDDEEDDDNANNEDRDDDEKEGDENIQQIKDRIEDVKLKIKEQTELLKKTPNQILRKKLARKIQDLKDDVAMMKKSAGLGGDEDDDDE